MGPFNQDIRGSAPLADAWPRRLEASSLEDTFLRTLRGGLQPRVGRQLASEASGSCSGSCSGSGGGGLVQEYALSSLIIALVIYMPLSIGTAGLALPMGYFVPSMFIGALTGRFV